MLHVSESDLVILMYTVLIVPEAQMHQSWLPILFDKSLKKTATPKSFAYHPTAQDIIQYYY